MTMNDAKHSKTTTDSVDPVNVRPTKAQKESDSAHSSTDERIAELEMQLSQAKDSLLRSQADYQNLQRRTQEEKARWLKLAARELITDLIQPLDHLSLAAQQLKDPGLDMTITQFWQTLKEHGLQEVEPLGQPFDVTTMDAVERKGTGETVIAVIKRGYTLHGEIIQHAKVIVGDQSETQNSKQ